MDSSHPRKAGHAPAIPIVVSHIKEVPGWSEELATVSEAVVKAEEVRAPAPPPVDFSVPSSWNQSERSLPARLPSGRRRTRRLLLQCTEHTIEELQQFTVDVLMVRPPAPLRLPHPHASASPSATQRWRRKCSPAARQTDRPHTLCWRWRCMPAGGGAGQPPRARIPRRGPPG